MKQLSGVSITTDEPELQQTGLATQPAPDKIVWEFWRMAQQRSYHGTPAIIDFGNLEAEDTDVS